MQDSHLFVEAALIGLAIAAPVGPVGLLCIERTLRQGAATGFVTGLGAATADAIYAAIGAAGLGTLIALLTRLATPLALAGCVLLLYLGIATLRRDAASHAARAAGAHSLPRAYGSALALTLTNPMTILSFIAIFAGLAGARTPSLADSVLMVMGVFAGSALWWLLLAYGGGRLLSRLGARGQRLVDKACGVLLIGFALLLAWRTLAGWQ